MAMQPLTLDSLKNLDYGRVHTAFQHELKRTLEDCRDRPGETAVRTVTLKCTITPVLEVDGDCNHVNAEFEIVGKVPARRSKPYNLRLTKSGAFFNEDSPDNADQTTIFDKEPTDD